MRLCYWPGFCRRLATGLALVLLTGLPALAREPVCLAEPRAALERAIAAHDDGVDEIEIARAVMRNTFPRLRGRVGEQARQYLSRQPRAALLFYAADAEATCAFLWVAGSDEPVYARHPTGSAALEGLINQLRTELTFGMADVLRAPKRRSADSRFEIVERPAGQKRAALSPIRRGEAEQRLAEIFFPRAFEAPLGEVDQLSIIPVLGMSTSPIAMLKPFGADRLAVERFAMTFIVFPGDIAEGPRGWRPGFSQPFIVGDPDARNDPEWLFDRLPHAATEAQAAQATFGGEVLTDKAATIRAYESRAGRADLIYIAAHGLSSASRPVDDGFLAFSDGRLTARMVMNLALEAAPVVVLSACQTGTGLNLFGGVVGLARAYRKAGAASTVMSLWSVEDQATLDLMRHFHVHLRDLPPPEALRRAMLATRTRHPDPGKWAAFNVFGNAFTAAAAPR